MMSQHISMPITLIILFVLGKNVKAVDYTTAYSHDIKDFALPSRSNWMANVDGTKHLNELTIPGTHDSGNKNIAN